MKDDELKLIQYINQDTKSVFSTYNLCKELDIPLKRLLYVLKKWDKKGYINYGTSLKHFWLEVDQIPGD